jgi:prepilin-type processing-associated H-X9-DG protein
MSLKRAGLSRIELLVASTIGTTLMGLLVIGLAGCNSKNTAPSGKGDEAKESERVNKTKIECTDHLRAIGMAMHEFAKNNSDCLPCDNDQGDYKGQSFYTQLLPPLKLNDLAPKGVPNPTGQAKPFLCPARRRPDQAPGGRDYGYIKSQGASYSSCLDTYGTSLTQISNCQGTEHTAVLSHLWMSPDDNTKVSPATNGWVAQYPNHCAARDKKGYNDTDPDGHASLGSPHPDAMPTLFADGHVRLLPYTYGQLREMWSFKNTVFLEKFPKEVLK